jgi:DeoR/GlpR family transcriptional regulator of sugar metabolism
VTIICGRVNPAIRHNAAVRAAEVILMASPEKLNAASPFTIISVNQIGALIVDEATDSSIRESFQKEGVHVVA